ncbi:hypothetical protein EV363DRAFT_1195229, partial [Boletus edulis]
RFILEDLKPRVAGATIVSWLPRRLYLQASSPAEILHRMNTSHRGMVYNIVLVPPAEASRIFTTGPAFPCRSWVRIKSGEYRKDLAYVFTCDDDTVDVLVVPRARPYDIPGEDNTRALFDWQTAYDAGLELPAIENSRDILAFKCNGCSYFVGLLRMSFLKDDLEHVLLPHPEEFVMFTDAGIDKSLMEETGRLFSSQYWIEGDSIQSYSPELYGQKATIVAVDHRQQSVSLCLDDRIYDCPIVQQRRDFSAGDHVRVVAGPDHGFEGIVTQTFQDLLVLASATDLSGREVSANDFIVILKSEHSLGSCWFSLRGNVVPRSSMDNTRFGAPPLL